MDTEPPKHIFHRPSTLHIAIGNLHPRRKVSQVGFRSLIKSVLTKEKVHGQVNIVLVDDVQMYKLNRTFRHRRKTTDVLVFNLSDRHKEAGESIGEIYISLDQAQRQAQHFRVSLRNELRRLMVHGALHLAGYDHHQPVAAQKMRAREKFYLRQ